MVSGSKQDFFLLIFSSVNAAMIFMQKNACAVLQKQPQLPGVLFSTVQITHGFFFFICVPRASGGSHQDLSHVVLGAPVVACACCLFIQIAFTRGFG